MTLQQLHDYVAVVAHGGYRAAARAVGRSQAVLTKSVAKLEGEYGIALLARGGLGSSLTSDGEEFLRYAQSALAEADRAQAWLTTPKRQKATDIALGVSLEPSMQLVPSVLQDFRRTLPGVTVRMNHASWSQLIAGVRENRLDLAITRVPDEWDASDLSTEVLYVSEPVVVARATHPLFKGTGSSDLSTYDWIVIGDAAQQGATDASFRELFDDEARSRLRIAAVTDSLFSAVASLLESDCVARLPRSALQHPLISNRLLAVPLSSPPRSYRVALVRKPGRPQHREVQTLAAMLVSLSRISRGMGRYR